MQSSRFMRVSSVSSEESEEKRFQLLEFVEKTAVENDDSSTSENFGSFSLFEDEKFTVKRSSQLQLKNEKCGKYFLVQFIASQENEGKAKRVNKQDVGVIASGVWGSTLCMTFVDCRLYTADCRLQTADRRPQTADYRPQTADCKLKGIKNLPNKGDTIKNITSWESKKVAWEQG